MAALVALAALLTIAVGSMAGTVVDAARAQTAADAAALASIEGGRGAASRLATAHGGVIVAWSQRGADVVVTVRVGDAVAVARATGGQTAPLDG
jgi:hypothetical protein